MISCQRACELISQAQDEPLSWRERAELRLHVLMCVNCRRYQQQIGSLTDFAQAFRTPEVDFDTSPDSPAPSEGPGPRPGGRSADDVKPSETKESDNE